MDGAFLGGGRVAQEPRTTLTRTRRAVVRIVETPKRPGAAALGEWIEAGFKLEERTQLQLGALQKIVGRGL